MAEARTKGIIYHNDLHKLNSKHLQQRVRQGRTSRKTVTPLLLFLFFFYSLYYSNDRLSSWWLSKPIFYSNIHRLCNNSATWQVIEKLKVGCLSVMLRVSDYEIEHIVHQIYAAKL